MKHFFPESFVIEVTGKDSTRYLQARLSNNIAALDLEQSCKASALNHQGKPLGIFYIYKKSTEEYLLIAEGSAEDEILAALLQFKVAERTTATIKKDHRVVHVLESNIDEITSPIISTQRTSLAGIDVIVEEENLSSFISESTELDQSTQQKERIVIGSPLFPLELDANKILLESGAADAVSFKKGCYLGQEILEKIDSHGKAPSMLLSYQSKEIVDLKKGDSLNNKEQTSIGKVVSAISRDSDNTTFAFVRIKNKGNIPETIYSNEKELTLIPNKLSRT